MFSKSWILFFLGTALLVATAHAKVDDVDEVDDAPANQEVSQPKLWARFKNFVVKNYRVGKERIDSVLQKIKSEIGHYAKLSKQQLAKLVEEGGHIKQLVSQVLREEKAKLQEKLAKYKATAKETGQVLAFKLKQLEQRGEALIAQKIQAVENLWEAWKIEAREAYAQAERDAERAQKQGKKLDLD
ncbi:hypothetical protein TKK_0004130 [Trichogramma kaykai]|uniref:Uncharacterized protein n=1 Tax=Trichogramma kaykai TaxID=54128 RepID=A0ABD2XMA0_9HYME